MLPMLPIYVSYFAGGSDKKENIFKRALCFVLGFTVVFGALGLFAGTLGSFLAKYQTAVNVVTGVIVILFGLGYLEVFNLPFFKGMGSIKKVEAASAQKMSVEVDTENTRYDGTPISRVNSADYPGPPWKQEVPPLEIYAWRGERMLSKSSWKGKCFQCIWANMANVTIQYDFDWNIVRNRFETFCYGPLSCKYYKMGPARAVPYKGVSGVKDEGLLDEICCEYRHDEDE